MLQKSDFARLFEYTRWANHRAMRASALLSVEDFRKDLGSSYGGVRGTLAHMMAAEWIWLERWKGVSPTRLVDEAEFPNVIALRERWVAIEDHRSVWLHALPKNGPASKIRYKNVKGEAFEAPLWQLVQHVVNHSTYHRGQVTTLLRQLGARAVGTDLVTWDRERLAKGKARVSADRS